MKRVETPTKVGTWWNDKSIDIYKIDKRNIALYGWNGYKFTECWEVANNLIDIIANNIEVLPIYEDTKIIDYIIVAEG